MTKRASLKEYGEWLFEDNSIINEKSIYLTESQLKRLERKLINEGWFDNVSDTALDIAQLGLTAVSFIPDPFVGPTAGAANVAISIGREDWLGTVLGMIGLIPALGDAVEGVGKFLRAILPAAQEGGAITQAIRTAITELVPQSSTIMRGIEQLTNFIMQNGRIIVDMFQAAGRGAGAGSLAAATAADAPAILRPIATLLDSAPIQSLLTGSRAEQIAGGIENGFSTLISLLNRAESLLSSAPEATAAITAGIGRAAGAAERGAAAIRSLGDSPRLAAAGGIIGAAQPVAADIETSEENATSTKRVVAESYTYTNTRLKKLAGIK